MLKKMYQKKYTRKQGESLWRYNRRISKKMRKDIAEIISGIILAAIIMVFMWVCIMYGGDDQCTFIKCNHGMGYYCCEQHGHDCTEND